MNLIILGKEERNYGCVNDEERQKILPNDRIKFRSNGEICTTYVAKAYNCPHFINFLQHIGEFQKCKPDSDTLCETLNAYLPNSDCKLLGAKYGVVFYQLVICLY